MSTKNWWRDSGSKVRTQPGGSSRNSSSIERRRSIGMPFRSVRAPGPSVDTRTIPGVGSVDEEPVADSYDGGGSCGCCVPDMVEVEMQIKMMDREMVC